MALPNLRGTQIGLRDPKLVDRLKSAMIAAEYAYEEPRGQIGGVIERRGIYHIIEGHHRMAAALEIFLETGDDYPVTTLLTCGLRSLVDRGPNDSRPLQSRSWWGSFRNWLGI